MNTQKMTIKKAHEMVSMQLYVTKGQTLPDLEKSPGLLATMEKLREAWIKEGMLMASVNQDTIRMAMSRASDQAKPYREAISGILKCIRHGDFSINELSRQLSDLERKLSAPLE